MYSYCLRTNIIFLNKVLVVGKLKKYFMSSTSSEKSRDKWDSNVIAVAVLFIVSYMYHMLEPAVCVGMKHADQTPPSRTQMLLIHAVCMAA